MLGRLSFALSAACLEGVLCPLLAFVETHLGSSPGTLPFEHPCAWLSELFIEQDDDMLEAAKALLAIYLKCERLVLLLLSVRAGRETLRLIHPACSGRGR